MTIASNRFLEISGHFFLMLLILSTCISKSAIDISFALLMLVSIGYLVKNPRRNWGAHHASLLIWLLPLAVGLGISFFSLSGSVKGSAAFLQQYRYFFLALPAVLFIRTEKTANILFWLLNLSALVSVGYGFSTIDASSLWGQTIGFHYIGRGSDLLISIALVNLVFLAMFHSKRDTWNIASKVMIGLNTVLILSAVILMMRRGSWLGFGIGVFTLLAVLKKYKLLSLVIVLCCISLYFSGTTVVQRVKSITDFENDDSNRERIQLLRTGTGFIVDKNLFFRGTGGKTSTAPYTDYFYSHDSEYQQRNSDIIKKNYFGNFHNSFLQMAVEYGLFFLLSYLASVTCLLVRLYRSLSHLPQSGKIYPIAAIVLTSGFFVSQFFHNDLYSYGGVPFVLVFTAGGHMASLLRRDASMPEETGAESATMEKCAP